MVMGYLNHTTHLDPACHLLTFTFLLAVHLPRIDANISSSSFLLFLLPISYFLVPSPTTNANVLTKGYFGSFSMDGLAMALWCVYHTTDFNEAMVRQSVKGRESGRGNTRAKRPGRAFRDPSFICN